MGKGEALAMIGLSPSISDELLQKLLPASLDLQDSFLKTIRRERTNVVSWNQSYKTLLLGSKVQSGVNLFPGSYFLVALMVVHRISFGHA